MGDHPPRAFRHLEKAEREQLFWELKSQSTARMGRELNRPSRWGPPPGQSTQVRQPRRARVLSAQERSERLSRSQPAGGGSEEVRSHNSQQPLTDLLRRCIYRPHPHPCRLRLRAHNLIQWSALLHSPLDRRVSPLALVSSPVLPHRLLSSPLALVSSPVLPHRLLSSPLALVSSPVLPHRLLSSLLALVSSHA